MKVGKLPKPIIIEVWNGEPLSFGTAAKLGQWAEEQRNAWAEVSNKATPWNGPINEQVNHFSVIAQSCANYRDAANSATDETQLEGPLSTLRNNISGVANAIRDGRTLTTDTPRFAQIKALSVESPDAATLLYVTQRSDALSQIQHFQQYGQQFYVGIIRLAGSPCNPEIDPTNHAAEIQTLKAQLRQDSETFQAELDGWSNRYEDFSADAHQADTERATAWQTELANVREDWQKLKKTYDEQLALQAPTQYWKDRETRSRTIAIWFGVAFLAVIGATMGLFVWQGLPYLHGIAGIKDVNVLVAALPVLIPAFIGVWMLRILGRLFAENLQLSIDAGERQTMVKTFLALMHDEQRGKALVTDDDRILILHSLFRPSSVSGKDDAPPVHWFDILSQKLGGGKP